jgi:hypothetical protein
MIGGVKPRSLKYNANRCVEFPQCKLATFGTFLEGFFTEFSSSVELNPTVIAPIGIDGHK